MSKSKFGRLGLCLVSLLGLMSLMSAPALGAGQPTQVSSSMSGSAWGINHGEMFGWANPNGAETTLTLEYREQGAGEFQVAGSGSIGSGTKQLGIKRPLYGLKPYAIYELRTKATNAFGTVYGSIFSINTPYWEISKTSLSHVASINSQGTATFEWTHGGGTKYKLSCQEYGSGSIGGEWGTGTGWSPTLGGCSFYRGETLACKPEGTSFKVDQAFTMTSEAIKFMFPEACAYYSEVVFKAANPFFVTMSGFNKGLQSSQSLVLTNQLKFAGWNVDATISTNWSVTGADNGKAFGAWPGE